MIICSVRSFLIVNAGTWRWCVFYISWAMCVCVEVVVVEAVKVVVLLLLPCSWENIKTLIQLFWSSLFVSLSSRTNQLSKVRALHVGWVNDGMNSPTIRPFACPAYFFIIFCTSWNLLCTSATELCSRVSYLHMLVSVLELVYIVNGCGPFFVNQNKCEAE